MADRTCPECHKPLPATSGGVAALCPPCTLRGVTSQPGFRQAYRLADLLGLGSMGLVYRGIQMATGREVAIKFWVRLESEELRQRFLREGQLLSDLKHPNVVELVEVASAAGLPYLVNEYLPGGNLATELAHTPRPGLARAGEVLAHVLAGLSACHRAGIVHRDLKPENVLFARDGTAKLADFGVARALGRTGVPSLRGVVLGTPRYASPEQARGAEVGAASDLYSVGVMLYEMLAGRVPFETTDLFGLLRAHVELAPPPLSELAPELAPEVVDLVDRLLAKDPAARPATADQVAAEMAALTSGQPAPHAGPSTAGTPAPAPTQRLDLDGPPALGIQELHLSVVDGPALGRDVPLGARPVTIGSAPECELALPDPAVSRQHARVSLSGGRFVLTDLGSTNGTFAQGMQVKEVFVRPGDRLRVGTTTLELRLKSRSAGVPAAAQERFGRLVGRSPSMRQLFTVLAEVAPTQLSVLITGPTGTGKEMVARSLHEEHPAGGPFVVLDCGAVDPGVISSELFGHEPGAFTGAAGRRIGRFEQANGGTIFLDEIGEMPLDIQPKLLRVLESRHVRRMGGQQEIPVQVRVVSATNRNLEEMVARGTFREDLYYRLCQVKVTLPQLSRRQDDIPLLVDSFLAAVAPDRRPIGVAPEVREFLTHAHWAGNVRQLRNLVDRAAILAPNRVIQMQNLLLTPEELDAFRGPAASTPGAAGPAAPPVGDAETPEGLRAALEANDWNLSRTARSLGIVLNTLKARMQRAGLPRKKE